MEVRHARSIQRDPAENRGRGQRQAQGYRFAEEADTG